MRVPKVVNQVLKMKENLGNLKEFTTYLKVLERRRI